jgi:hypothetical protein
VPVDFKNEAAQRNRLRSEHKDVTIVHAVGQDASMMRVVGTIDNPILS